MKYTIRQSNTDIKKHMIINVTPLLKLIVLLILIIVALNSIFTIFNKLKKFNDYMNTMSNQQLSTENYKSTSEIIKEYPYKLANGG